MCVLHQRGMPWATKYTYGLIVFCNASIIYKVCLSNQRWQHGGEHSARISGMTATLMVVSISHLFLSAPISITFILHQVDVISTSKFRFMANICAVFTEINNSINFFLYCITGSKFRQEIKLIFK